MTQHHVEERLAAWYELASAAAPERLRSTVLALPDRIETTIATIPAEDARRSRTGATSQRLMVAAAAIAAAVVVAVAVSSVSPRSDENGATASSSPSSLSSPSVGPTPRVSTDPRLRTIGPGKVGMDPGAYELTWPFGATDVSIGVTIPDGWWRVGGDAAHVDDTAIYTGRGRVYAPMLGLAAHTVTQVVTSVCAADAAAAEVGPTYVDAGTTVDDLTAAIRRIEGTSWTEPQDAVIGGYPAKQLATTFASAVCPGPGRRYIWMNQRYPYFVENGVTTTVYVVDVDGARLVLTSDDRRATPDVVAQLDGILASIRIPRPTVVATPAPTPAASPLWSFPTAEGPDSHLRIGRHRVIVDGVWFTFDVTSPSWEPQRPFYITRSVAGPQGAEAILLWTTFPDDRFTDPCPGVLGASIEPSMGGLAHAIATAPGVDVVGGPTDVTIGGRAATRITVTVREDLGCDPAYFSTYEPVRGGALWIETSVGDTITVWVVDVGGAVLFIEGETTPDAGHAAEDIQRMVDSMRFE